MRIFVVIAFGVSVALVVASCGGVERAPYGGPAEQQLAAATTAVDVASVARLLAAGANPNQMVKVDGHDQSAWFLSLYQMRPNRPDMVEVVRAMLKAGANPESAWGTNVGSVKNQESVVRSFMGPSRRSGSGPDAPLHVAMLHPVPEVVRALVAAGLNPRHGQAALVMAIEEGDVEIAHILVDAGVDVNGQPGANTPLVAAIEARNVSLMTYLEAHGAREKP